jgi:tripartite-type tricarboxylate transporter receptor subunit TctC
MHTGGTNMLKKIGALALAATLGLSGATQAQTYPDQPIRFIVGFSAGGFADTMGRILGQAVSEKLGQPVVVENVGGAGGNIAATQVAAADPDGYTVLVTTASLALSVALGTEMEFKIEDLVPVVIPVSSPEVLAAHPSVPAKNLAELVAWAKTQDRVTLGTAGAGTSSQLITSYFLKEVAGLDNIVEVAYKGGGPANQAAISGEVNLVGSSNSAYQFIREGLLTGIAVAATGRHDAIPDVGTYAEQGFEGLVAASWVGLLVPAGTDPAIIEKLNAAVNEALDDPSVMEKFKAAGVMVSKNDVAGTAKFLSDDIASWTKMVKASMSN